MMYLVYAFFGTAAISTVLYNALVEKTIVSQTEIALLYINGVFKRILKAGVNRYFRIGADVVRLDARQQIQTIASQDLLTADNVSIKLSMAVTFRISDAVKALHEVESYFMTLYTEVQLALRGIVNTRELEAIVADRNTISNELTEQIRDKAAEYGVKIIAAAVKDVMFSADLKRIFSEVVRARQEGQARLEQARAESASMRSLANAARMLKDNPELAQLRWIQTMSDAAQSTGNTLIVGLSKDIVEGEALKRKS
jgi:regulator of protease activity HflC (stomatin/prohibitin superfamily)